MTRTKLARWIGALMLALGCSSGGTDPGGNGSIAIALSPTGATVLRGGSTLVVATLTRGGGFTGTVNFTAEGAPTGVTASVGASSTVGGTTTATVTVTVAASVAPGTYPITIRGTGSGVSPTTAVFTLTVVAQASFTLSVNPANASLAQTQAQDFTVTVNRVAYTGAITFSAENLADGVTPSFNPAVTNGNTTTLTLTASATAVPGNSVATIRGTGPDPSGPALRVGTTGAALIGSTNLPITLGAANLNVDFSGCAVEFQPLWAAVQDGSGAWRRVGTIAPHRYRAHVAESKGGMAFVVPGQFFFGLRQGVEGGAALRNGTSPGAPGGGVRNGTLLRAAAGKRHAEGDGFDTFIQYGSQAELIALAGDQCPAAPTTKTINGSVSNVGGGEFSTFSLGGSVNSISGNGPFLLQGVAEGLQDFFAYTGPAAAVGSSDRMAIRRDQNLAHNATMPVVNMAVGGSGEAFYADLDLITVTNAGTDALYQNMGFYSTNQCRPASLYSDIPVGANPFYAYGVSDARLRASDYHQIGLQANSADFSTQRYLFQSFHSLAPSSVRIPDNVPVPVLTSPAGPYKRLGASFTTPTDYVGTAQFPYLYLFLYAEDEGAIRGGGSGAALRLRDRAFEVAPFNGVVIQATQTWFGTGPAAVVMPDYSSLSEWNNAWGPANGVPGIWLLELFHATASGACVEGSRQRLGFRIGLY